jgi:hypothetical protein
MTRSLHPSRPTGTKTTTKSPASGPMPTLRRNSTAERSRSTTVSRKESPTIRRARACSRRHGMASKIRSVSEMIPAPCSRLDAPRETRPMLMAESGMGQM